MKALVLSGGTGTRLRPFSHTMPKQLIPVANKPVLEHVLKTIRDLGVTEIGLVVGDWEAEIAAVVGDGTRLGVRITYIRQDRPLGLAHCVRIARDFLADDDFVMYLGDNLLMDGVAEIAEEFAEARPAAQVVVHKVPDPRAFGVAELDEHGSIVQLVEKPEHPRSDLALIGVYFFTPAIHEAVAAIVPSARGELEITDAIQWLVTHGIGAKASEYSGYWKDAGRIEDVLECNRKVLDAQLASIAGDVDDASVLSGAVVLEAGARVVRSRVEGPVVIGAGSLVEDSQVGPYTSIGRDCRLHGTHLRDSITLDGVSISRVLGLRGSVIGRGAVVGTVAPGGTGEHRLVIGDHARVEVAA